MPKPCCKYKALLIAKLKKRVKDLEARIEADEKAHNKQVREIIKAESRT